MTLTLSLCEDRLEWDAFQAGSPQGNIFCSPSFLDALGEEYELWMVKENGRPQLGAVILKHGGQPIRAPYPFTMYQGILFDQVFGALPHHTRVSSALRTTEFLLQEIEQRYGQISFCTHHSVEDLRAFLWFHHHTANLGQFQVDLRYTGVLDLQSVTDFEAYLTSISTLRRREYRRGQATGLFAEESVDVATLSQLHRLTLERQGVQRSAEEERLLVAISEAAISKGFGWLLLCRDKEGTAISATLFLRDRRSGYYLIGANHPDYRRSGSGTFLLVENIRRCAAMGLSAVDFVGINSPNRGDFKISLGAIPVPYFIVNFERTEEISLLD